MLTNTAPAACLAGIPLAAVLANTAPAALFAAVAPAAMLTNASPATLPAAVAHTTMFTDADPTAILAVVPLETMVADAGPAALFAAVAYAAVLADAAPAALPASAAHAAMLTNAGATALFAAVTPAAVFADAGPTALLTKAAPAAMRASATLGFAHYAGCSSSVSPPALHARHRCTVCAEAAAAHAPSPPIIDNGASTATGTAAGSDSAHTGSFGTCDAVASATPLAHALWESRSGHPVTGAAAALASFATHCRRRVSASGLRPACRASGGTNVVAVATAVDAMVVWEVGSVLVAPGTGRATRCRALCAQATPANGVQHLKGGAHIHSGTTCMARLS